MKPIHFEVATYLMYAFTVLLITFRFRDHRDYWYALFGCTLGFPYEWVADKYWMFLDYDWGFSMLFDRLPLMMPFAWGWFFALPLIFCLRFSSKIDALPLWLRITLLYGIFWLWDFLVEYSSTSYRLWVYHWTPGSMFGGILPWFIPVMVASANTLLYFGHKMALVFSSKKGWFQGFIIHLITYYIIFTLQVLIGWPLIILLGIKPIPGP
jgi:hypothetical protein